MRKVTHSPRETTYSAPYNCKKWQPTRCLPRKRLQSSPFSIKIATPLLPIHFGGKNGVVIVQLKTSSVLALSTPLSDEISFEQLAAGKQAPISNKLKNFFHEKRPWFTSLRLRTDHWAHSDCHHPRRCRHHQWRKFLPSIVPLLQT